jgi:hypothetical protein
MSRTESAQARQFKFEIMPIDRPDANAALGMNVVYGNAMTGTLLPIFNSAMAVGMSNK